MGVLATYSSLLVLPRLVPRVRDFLATLFWGVPIVVLGEATGQDRISGDFIVATKTSLAGKSRTWEHVQDTSAQWLSMRMLSTIGSDGSVLQSGLCPATVEDIPGVRCCRLAGLLRRPLLTSRSVARPSHARLVEGRLVALGLMSVATVDGSEISSWHGTGSSLLTNLGTEPESMNRVICGWLGLTSVWLGGPRPRWV